MKNIYFFILVFSIFISIESKAQQGMLSALQGIDGESYGISAGIHTGIFDSNHADGYPYNLGIVAQFNYFPDIRKIFYLGTELGAFFTSSKIDKYGRETNVALADISVFPGISIPIGSKVIKTDNGNKLLRKLKTTRRLNFGFGFTVVFPLRKRSAGSRVKTDAIKSGLGFSLRSSFDLKNRLAIFANITRIGKDLDGYSIIGSNTPSKDNKFEVSYYYKIGVLWNFIKK